MTKLYSETMGQGPDIVLLHGWGIHSGIWQFIAAKLSKEFRVTLIDLPGFGRSEMLADYSIENIVEHLLLVAPSNALWIGWSLGGLIATKMALIHPERVRKLICVASSPRFLKSADWPGMDISVLKKFNEQLSVDYEACLKRFLLLQFYGMTLDKEMISWLNLNLFLYGRPQMQALNAGLDILATEDLRSALKHLSCPLLYVLGKMDALVPFQIVEILNRLHSNIRSVVFPKASHALFLSHEDEFLTEVRRFSYE